MGAYRDRREAPVTGDAEADYFFADFRLSPRSRRLVLKSEWVKIGSRSFDLLLALVRRAGETLPAADLMALAWPNVTVDQANLRVQMVTLRKLLALSPQAGQAIATVPLQGYCFTLPVTRSAAAPLRPAIFPAKSNLPVLLIAPTGRDEDVHIIADALTRRRLVTIIGPGGIGKTTAAITVARRLSALAPDTVRFVDFSPTREPGLVAETVAIALSIGAAAKDPVAAIVAHLVDRHMLLLLDTCEHLIEAVADLAEQLLTQLPGIRILVTSRESLRATGEWVHRLPSLALPAPGAVVDVAGALGCSAVALFVERVGAGIAFELTPAALPFVVDICTRLDGIPLAIELAAARVPEFGLQTVAARLNDRFSILTQGRRTALPRHQTLAATLDWSYELLPEGEKAILRAASIFPGPFCHEGLTAVISAPASVVSAALSALFDKSLVTGDRSMERSFYRLLDTTREYGRMKAGEQSELEALRRAHAVQAAKTFAIAEREAEQQGLDAWLERYGQDLDNVRAALDWAGGPDGDPALVVALTVSAVPLWSHLSLLNELQQRVEAALALVRQGAGHDARHEMKLLAALSNVMMNLFGPTSRTREVCREALAIAERIGDPNYQARALLALWNGCFSNGEIKGSLGLGRKFMTAAEALGEADVLVAHRLVGFSHFYLGNAADGRRHLETMVAGYEVTRHDGHVARFVFDQQASAKGMLASILCYQGMFDRAMDLTRETVDEITRLDHALTICGVLGTTCAANAIYTGQFEEAERYTALLGDTARRHGLQRWEAVAWGYEGIMCLRRGDLAGGLQRLGRSVQRLDHRTNVRYMIVLAEYCEAMAARGDAPEALAIAEDVVARLWQTSETWYLPEFLRCRAQLLRLAGHPAEAVDAAFQDSLALGESLGALNWTLRASADYADFLVGGGRIVEAEALLGTIRPLITDDIRVPHAVAAGALSSMLVQATRGS